MKGSVGRGIGLGIAYGLLGSVIGPIGGCLTYAIRERMSNSYGGGEIEIGSEQSLWLFVPLIACAAVAGLVGLIRGLLTEPKDYCPRPKPGYHSPGDDVRFDS